MKIHESETPLGKLIIYCVYAHKNYLDRLGKPGTKAQEKYSPKRSGPGNREPRKKVIKLLADEKVPEVEEVCETGEDK